MNGGDWQQYDANAYGQAQWVDDDDDVQRAIQRSLGHNTASDAADDDPQLRAALQRSIAMQQGREPVAVFTSDENAPLTDDELHMMPQCMFSPSTNHTADDDTAVTCTMCFEEYDEASQLMILPCFHRFHWACVADWLKKRPECPICKTNPKHSGASQLLEA